MRNFAKAVAVGTVVGAAPAMIVTVPLGLLNIVEPLIPGQGAIVASLLLAVSPLVICFGFVLAASLAVGLPLTLVLKRCRQESAVVYLSAGGLVGTMLPALTLLSIAAAGGYWICALGAMSGIATARMWWLTREQDLSLVPNPAA